MLKKLFLYITLFWSAASVAQPYLSVRGDFSIDQRRGCRDLLITVTNINPGTDVILYQYEGRGSAVASGTTHNYTTSGSYWLLQYIQGPTGQKVDSIFVEILDPVIVPFELQTCNNNDVQVQILNNDYDLYEIDYGDGAIGSIIQVPVNTFPPIYNYAATANYNVTVTGLYTTANNRCGTSSQNFTPVNQVLSGTINILQTISSSSIVLDFNLAPNTSSSLEISLNNGNFQLFKTLNQNTSRDTLPGLQLKNNIYCFRITSHDACSNYKAYSNELCSIDLNVNSLNDAMSLNWTTTYGNNFQSLEINRDQQLLVSLANQTMSYNDSTSICNTNYCYQLTALYNDGSRSISEELCGTALSSTKPESVSNIISRILDNEIIWQWITPMGNNVSNYKVKDQRGQIIANTDQNILQTAYLADTQTCLSWEFTNSCDNISNPSPTICAFTISSIFNSDGSTDISWQPYLGYAQGVMEYIIVVYDIDFLITDSLSVGMNLSYTDPLPLDDQQISYYKVYALPMEVDIDYSISNRILTERSPIISIPSAFTPNNDGLNDLFEVSGKYIQSQEVTILNRWGSILYSSTDNFWDGMIDGKKAPLGSYLYQVTIKDFIGKEHIRTGSVLILKD